MDVFISSSRISQADRQPFFYISFFIQKKALLIYSLFCLQHHLDLSESSSLLFLRLAWVAIVLYNV